MIRRHQHTRIHSEIHINRIEYLVKKYSHSFSVHIWKIIVVITITFILFSTWLQRGTKILFFYIIF